MGNDVEAAKCAPLQAGERGRKGSGDAYSRGEDKRRSVVTLERTLTYLFQKLTKHTKHVKEHF